MTFSPQTSPKDGARLGRIIRALLLGLTGARAVSLSSLALFVYLVGPEPFAGFGFYYALASILWIPACLRYEQALIFATDSDEETALFWLSVGLGAISVLLLALGLLLGFLVGWTPPATLSWVALFFLPLSLAGRVASRILINHATRHQLYAAISRALFVQAFAQACLLGGGLAMGASPLLILIAADALGLLAAAATVFVALKQRENGFGQPIWHQIRAAARHWLMMPTFNLPSSLLSVAALALPGLLLPSLLSAAIAGQILFAMRLLELPSNLMTGLATPILQGELQRGEAWPLIRRTIILLAAASAALFAGCVIAANIAPYLFDLALWQVAIAALAFLIPYFVGLTISGPLVDIVAGFRAERSAFPIHIAFLAMMGLAFVPFWTGHGWREALTGFGIAMGVRTIWLVWRLKAASQ